jgi:hypothetical protein
MLRALQHVYSQMGLLPLANWHACGTHQVQVSRCRLVSTLRSGCGVVVLQVDAAFEYLLKSADLDRPDVRCAAC